MNNTTNPNQGCDKMEHKEHGSNEFVDICNTVDKDEKQKTAQIQEMRLGMDEAHKNPACKFVEECLKKAESQ